MPEDLSYLLSKPTEEEEHRIQEAITRECIKAIAIYLGEVADKMESSNIESLNVPTLRAMAQELINRNANNEENA